MMKLLVLLGFLFVASAVQADRTIRQRYTTKHGVSTLETLISKAAQVVSAPDDEDMFNINRRNKLDLMDGDIKKGRDSRSSITDTSQHWPGYSIAVEYSPSLPLLARCGIDEARLEYEMRTCMTFPDRVNEKNYLYFEPLSGCWSSVGMQGGQQTISIGSGCEKRATIQHEMMHALGIYHQQSRTDRDDYVKIMSENIEDDHLHNFNTYDYDKVDERRVPYDYNSVMHYSDTSFSMNGEKSIVTHDPAFQDVIGQRRTFSEGDADMINRMYPCGDPLRVSYSCGFETANACGYVQESDANPLNMVSTDQVSSTKDNAPVTDNTFGEKQNGHYMLYDSTTAAASEVSTMRSMRLKTNVDTQCLEFAYYMDLNSNSKAQVRVSLAQIDETTGAVTSSKVLTGLTGDHGKFWNLERFSFQAGNEVYKLLFEVESGGYSDDVIALDDIQIQDKPCETNYFKIQEWSKLLENTEVGDAVYGPLLYTDEGYAFKLLFYPKGRSTSEEGYISMFFALARGENDDSLAWPFYDRVIKMSVVDQGEEKLTSMNQFSQFITSDSRPDYWSQPDSSMNGGIGYTKFITLSDVMNTRNFVKNDAVIFSINVRNMQVSADKTRSNFALSSDSVPMGGPSHHEEGVHREINININMPQQNATETATSDDNDNMMTLGAAIGLAMACTFVAMAIMLIVLISVNESHKKSIRAISALARNAGGNKNHGYNEQKI